MQTSVNSVTTNNSQSINTSKSVSTDNAKNTETSFKDELSKTAKNKQQNETEVNTANEQATEDISNNNENSTSLTESTKEENNNQQTLVNSSNQQNPNELSKELTSIAEAIQNKNFINSGITHNIHWSTEHTDAFSLYISKGVTADGQTYDMPAISMTKEDALFFVGLTDNATQNINQLNATTGTSATSSVISTQLLTILNQAMQDNQPVRIDFDNNIAVILKVDKDGKISANFIPGDTAVENYLRNNIQFLRQTFDEKGLAYNELTYKQSKQGNREQHHNKEQQKDE